MRKIKLLLYSLLCFSQTGCLKSDSNGFFIFKIKKGNHRSVNRIQRTSSDELNFSLILTESCKYESKDPQNQYDVNKVFGMSDGGDHKENSARIGWRYVGDKIELHAYTHYNGNFDFKKICDIDTEKEYQCQISFLENEYQFIVNGVSVYMPRYKNSDKKKYLLYPYFGGDEVAPHDMILKIKF